MKAYKYDWNQINEFCRENIVTRKEISKHFNISLNTIHSAIRLNLIHKENVKVSPRVTSESKSNISLSMKIAHKEGRHPGWSFINKDVNRRSYPEKVFFKILDTDPYFKKFKIIEKLSFGRYFLDFAFIEKKVDVEIDGQQHFRSEMAICHDKERDTFLNQKNWIVYRIAWKKLQQNQTYEIEQFKKFLEYEIKENRIYDIEDVKQYYKIYV